MSSRRCSCADTWRKPASSFRRSPRRSVRTDQPAAAPGPGSRCALSTAGSAWSSPFPCSCCLSAGCRCCCPNRSCRCGCLRWERPFRRRRRKTCPGTCPGSKSLSADAGWDVIRLPQPGWPIYHLWLKSGEQAYFLPGADSFLDRFLPLQRPESFLYELHAHLLAGKSGKELVRVLSVVLLVMATLGLFLWWPYRSRFRVADALPRRAIRMHLTRSHMTLAILVAPFLFFTLAVAWAMAYPDAARAALGGVFGQSQLMDQRVVVADQGDRFNWLLHHSVCTGCLSG